MLTHSPAEFDIDHSIAPHGASDVSATSLDAWNGPQIQADTIPRSGSSPARCARRSIQVNEQKALSNEG